eukprot:m.111924 g.111924  ORF g.111924 m.111924 type:complete len:331 (-) comp15961_c0_seq7:339-1331(-)
MYSSLNEPSRTCLSRASKNCLRILPNSMMTKAGLPPACRYAVMAERWKASNCRKTMLKSWSKISSTSSEESTPSKSELPISAGYFFTSSSVQELMFTAHTAKGKASLQRSMMSRASRVYVRQKYTRLRSARMPCPRKSVAGSLPWKPMSPQFFDMRSNGVSGRSNPHSSTSMCSCESWPATKGTPRAASSAASAESVCGCGSFDSLPSSASRCVWLRRTSSHWRIESARAMQYRTTKLLASAESRSSSLLFAPPAPAPAGRLCGPYLSSSASASTSSSSSSTLSVALSSLFFPCLCAVLVVAAVAGESLCGLERCRSPRSFSSSSILCAV